MAIEDEASEGRQRRPPYVEYHSFRVFLDEARKDIPERVNLDYLKTTEVAKSSYHMLIAGLRSLGLIDTDSKPTPLLGSLLRDPDVLAEIAKTTYADLLTRRNLLSLPASQMGKYFEKTYGLSPSVSRRCAQFFMRLAKDTRLLPNKRRRTQQSAVGAPMATREKRSISALKAEVLQKLPDFTKNSWEPQEVQAVLERFDKLLAHLEE